MYQRANISKRQFAIFVFVLVIGVLITALLAREVYISTIESAREDFQDSAELYLERVHSELEEGFVAAEDFQFYFFVSNKIDEVRFNEFIDSYTALKKNRTLLALVFSATGEVDRKREFSILNEISRGGPVTSWNLDGVRDRELADGEEAFYVRYYWPGDVAKSKKETISLEGAEVGQYNELTTIMNKAVETGRSDAGLFTEHGDKISKQFGNLNIVSPFEIAPSIELFLVQSVDLKELLKDVEEVAGVNAEFVSFTKPVFEQGRRGTDTPVFTVGKNGPINATDYDPSQYWHFSKTENLANSEWQYTVYADPASFKIKYDTVFIEVITGLSITCLVGYIVWSQILRTNRISGIVDRRTKALRDAHDELEHHYRMLQRMNHDVEEARLSAETANMAKSEFLATMSHELRTPLNAILGFSQLLQEETLGPIGDERYKEYAGDIHNSGRHLLNIINDILDLAKLEAGKVKIERKPLSIEELVGHVISLLQQQASDKKLELSYEIAEEMPTSIVGDELRLRQILINLVSNSIKFTKTGSVTIRFLAKKFKNGRAGWIMEVQDTGIGIPEDKQSLLFDRFTQVDTALSRRHGGVGLGLAICRELVGRMDGIISVRSTPNVGTTIRAQLPLDVAEEQDVDEAFI